MENQNNEEEYVVTEFGVLMQELGYAYERQYPPYFHISNGITYFTVYKLTFCSEGWYEYKGHYTKFDTKLWPKLELLGKVLTDDPTIKLFYEND